MIYRRKEPIMKPQRMFFAMSLITLAVLTGCSSQPPRNALLDQARSDYQTAQSTPEARDLAGGEMRQAADALKLAEEASTRGDDASDVTHLAYVARQRVAIAQETGRQKAAEASVSAAQGQRDKVRLAARTTEVDTANRSAASARQDSREARAETRDLEAHLRALNARQTPRGMVITIGDVLFDTDRSELRQGGMRNMEKLATFLKTYPQRKARIEGFTDSSGSDSHNQALSVRRAEAVMNALTGMGIGSDRLTAQGFGETSPVADNSRPAGRQMNRRVEVVLSDENGQISSR
jgi:outer membrane protein OmpA-like peptidoglycan-associated protein